MRNLLLLLPATLALALPFPTLAMTPDEDACNGRAADGFSTTTPFERVQACNRVLQTMPRAKQSHWLGQRAEGHRALRNFDLALADHQAAYTASPNAYNYFEIIEDLISLGRYNEALASIERILREDWLSHYGTDGTYHELRGRVFAKAGRRDDALEALSSMLRQRLHAARQSGKDQGKRDRSGEDLLAEMEKLTGRPTIIPERRLSECQSLGSAEKRLAACNRVINGDWVPDEDIRTARWERARLFAQARDWPAALAELGRLLRDHPDDGDALLLRAQVQLHSGNVDQAIKEYTWLFDRTGDSNVRFHRAQAYVSARRFEPALDDLRALDAQYPGNPPLQSFIRQVEQARDAAAANPSGG